MRTRKVTAAQSPLARLKNKILGYIDLFVRTVCIILGLVVSGWVKFIDETTPAAANRGGTTAPQWSPTRPLAPLPGLPATAAQPTYTDQPAMYR